MNIIYCLRQLVRDRTTSYDLIITGLVDEWFISGIREK